MSPRRTAVAVHGVALDPTKADDRARLSELKVGAIRLRNYGANVSTIADKLGLSESDAETVLSEGLREVMADDAETVRARQQATLNDIRRAMYPAMATGDKDSANVILKVLAHEAELHEIKAPQRLRIGLDQETFTTTVDEDMRALGIHPRMDVPLDDEGDDEWANT